MSTMKQEFLKKIKDHTLTAGVVGLDYADLLLAVEKAKAEFKTITLQTAKCYM